MKTREVQAEKQAHGSLWAIVLTIVCTFTVITGNGSLTMVSIALPLMAEDLNIPQARLQWIISAYSLSSGCFFLLFGRIADLYGRKRVFVVGQVWFAAFTLGGGFARNDIVLDVLRALAGMAPAATIPAALGILAHAFPPGRARSLAFACFSAGAPLGGVVGWVVAAPLVQFSSPTWRTPFYLMAGLGLLLGVAAFFVIDNDNQPALSSDGTEGGADRSIDWVGAALITTGLVLLTFALAQGEVAEQGWKTPYIIALLVVSPFFVAAFVVWEWWYEHRQNRAPLLRVGIFTRGRGTFSVVLAIAFFEFCAFYAWIYWTTLFYQQLQGKTPMLVMVRFLPMPVVGLSLNVLVGFFAAHIPLVYLVVGGTGATALACLLFAIIDEHATYWAYNFPAAVLSVFGADLVFAPGSIYVAKIALPHEQSVAGGLFQTVVQLGSAFGIAISTIVHDAGVRGEMRKQGISDHLEDVATAPHAAQLRGYRDGFWTSFAFVIFGMVLGALFLRRVGVVGDKSPKKVVVDDQSEESRGLDEKRDAPASS
ncbi:putative efflux transporter [Auriculariales sp. MPI-PUGE-AT-0066]|nr:putative efflux transporter [Auriculariales sp. MPI-PUGE-AT-0066]